MRIRFHTYTLSLHFLWSVFIIISLSWGPTAHAQQGTENRERKLIIRSGLTAMAGYSHLNLDDALRPYLAKSTAYQFGSYPFMKIGALITLQPKFFGDHFQLVFDPAFSKYSWGNDVPQGTDSITNGIDIDLEALEFPISLRYSIRPSAKTIQPFIRAGYSLSYIVDTEAQFRTKIYSKEGTTELLFTDFPFADYQHAVSLGAGVEFNLHYVDYTLVLCVQKSEGIDDIRDRKNFMSYSNTTNYYLQVGVLF